MVFSVSVVKKPNTLRKVGKMRRSDREVINFDEILDILKRADTIRLGLNGDPYPYVVPLSFGFEATDAGAGSGTGDAGRGGRCVAVYVHGAAEGFKHDLIARDNHVCVEAGIFHRYVQYDDGAYSNVTTEYESVIGFGTADVATGAEAEHGMALMLEHCGFADSLYNMDTLINTRIYKFTLTQITGKRRTV